MRLVHRLAFASWLLLAVLSAIADWNTSAPMPPAESTAPAQFRDPLGATTVVFDLGPLDPAAIDEVKRANSASLQKKVQIGIGRAVAAKLAAKSPSWVPVAGGGYAARWELRSPGAQGLRLELARIDASLQAEVRFAGSGRPGTVYGPFPGNDFADGSDRRWSPVLEGEGAIVEVHVAELPSAQPGLAIAQVSHLFVGPWQANAESLAKASQSCEVDFICRAASDAALTQTGKAVARMTFGDGTGSGSSYLCTGTLLNPIGGSGIPYFYSANHCISTQASASTLTTHWFYDRSGCGFGSTSSSYVQVSGGATLLYANAAADALLLRLNSSPPAGAILSGWDSATVSSGAAVTAVHHPAGDWKKVSLGTIGGFGAPDGAGSNYIISNWNSTATGVTEGGSSGSGLFTFNGAEYVLRGGLYGGPSSCTASGSDLRDYYSRFDQVYPAIAQYLNPTTVTCGYSLSPTSASVNSGGSSGSVTVTTTGGCTWSATSNASWLTLTGSTSGSGSGSVSYSVAANAGAARTGTITIGGISFTVNQQAPATSGTNFLANPGFETGTASWSQSATGGAAIIYQDSSNARSGSWYAWLGGYNGGSDTLYQNVTIPSGTTTLRFWYRIQTQEAAGTTAFDTLRVSINSASTGAQLSALVTLSNANASSAWTQSAAYDVSAFSGQTVRLVFQANMDASLITNFFIDDITLTSTSSGGAANYTALWWNPAESGWGVNFNHQGSTLFASMFTYDGSGAPMWLVSTAAQSGESFSGSLLRTTGPPFNANPFTPIGAGNITTVGTFDVAFSGSTGTMTYSVNGISVTKTIQKQVFGSRAANCTATTTSRASLTNYQDLWWNPAESGWGINLTHQDNTIFGSMFNYRSSGQGVWWVATMSRQSDGSYFGSLLETTGPPFNANPFTPIGAGNITTVGTMRLTFTNGTSGTLAYSVNGVNVTKSIVRQEFGTSFPACS